MSIQRFETGPRMSQVVVNGNTVYLAGVVANKAKGKSTTEQTQEILSIIDGHLAKAGTDKSKLLSTNIYITDMKNFAEMNAVWDKWVSPGNTPARATVEAKLAAPAIYRRDHGGRGEVNSRRTNLRPERDETIIALFFCRCMISEVIDPCARTFDSPVSRTTRRHRRRVL